MSGYAVGPLYQQSPLRQQLSWRRRGLSHANDRLALALECALMTVTEFSYVVVLVFIFGLMLVLFFVISVGTSCEQQQHHYRQEQQPE